MIVGIVSRDSPQTYPWLLHFLYSFLPENNVRTVVITNHSALFIDGISFAILYHSKTRGRLNVTDVEDSLYDEELQKLSRALGSKNVIVVIDHLDDNSEEVKNSLLRGQRNIDTLARDLFLFNKQKKGDDDKNPTNLSNKAKMQKMIRGSSGISMYTTSVPVRPLPPSDASSRLLQSPSEEAPSFYGRTHPYKMLCRLMLIIPVAAALFFCFVLWYNCRFLTFLLC